VQTTLAARESSSAARLLLRVTIYEPAMPIYLSAGIVLSASANPQGDAGHHRDGRQPAAALADVADRSFDAYSIADVILIPQRSRFRHPHG